MLEAYRLTRKDGAPGIDGMSAADYEANLEVNLDDLLGRIKSGRYVAPPVRRHYIPKADGTKRPLGIPTLEDKVAQRAILLLLEPIYETDFLSCSYGFRPGRSAHDALRALRDGSWNRGCVGWWTSISPNTSTPSTTLTCGASSTSGSGTALSGR
jgi:retron-type reverse transcriptase